MNSCDNVTDIEPPDIVEHKTMGDQKYGTNHGMNTTTTLCSDSHNKQINQEILPDTIQGISLDTDTNQGISQTSNTPPVQFFTKKTPFEKIPTGKPKSNEISMLSNQLNKNKQDQSKEETKKGKHTVSDLQIYYEKILGTGSFSKVFPGKYKGEMVAIKIISTQHLEVKIARQLQRELQVIRVLQKHPHPNIATYYKIFYAPDKMIIVMELCSGGELTKRIKAGLKLDQVRNYFLQILEGYKHLLELNIVHRDIKSANILLSHDMKTAKFIDFGLSKIFSVDLNQTICGSPLYMAPELLNHQDYDSKSDIWSLGVLLYEMVYGVTPFHKCKEIKTLKHTVQTNKIKYPQKSINNLYNVPSKLIEYMKHMLEYDPLRRTDWDNLYNISWLKDTIDDTQLNLHEKLELSSINSSNIYTDDVYHDDSPSPKPPLLRELSRSEIEEIEFESHRQNKKNDEQQTGPTKTQGIEILDKSTQLVSCNNSEKTNVTRKTNGDRINNKSTSQKPKALDRLPTISNLSQPIEEKQDTDVVDSVIDINDILMDNINNSIEYKKSSEFHTYEKSSPIPIRSNDKKIKTSRSAQHIALIMKESNVDVDHRSEQLNDIPSYGVSYPSRKNNTIPYIGSSKPIACSPSVRAESFGTIRPTDLRIEDISVIDNKYGDDLAPIVEKQQMKASDSGLIDINDVSDLLIATVPGKTTAYEYIYKSSAGIDPIGSSGSFGSYVYSRSAPIASSIVSGLSKVVHKTTNAVTTIIKK